MIAHRKPARRAAIGATLAFTLVFLAAGFIPAADPPPADGPPPDSAKRERTLQALERELAKLERLISNKEEQLHHFKRKLGISDAEAAGQGPSSPEVAQKLQTLCHEARAEATRSETFYRHLTNLSRVELKKAVVTAQPDPQLPDLLSQLHVAEPKLASMSESYGPEHPEVRSTRRLQEKLSAQIEDRLDGILRGLAAKAEADRARASQLEKELEQWRQREIELANARRPYFKAKRELETLETMRERLHLRLLQEQIDAAVAAAR